LEYSYLQLRPEIQNFFAQLSVFRGGWSLDAIETIHSRLSSGPSLDVVESLSELRERSLIETEDFGYEMRYRMLESLREFALDQLSYAESLTISEAHAEYFRDLSELAKDKIIGPSQQSWIKKIDTESQNISAALRWTLDAGKIETGLRIASALAIYWKTRGRLQEAMHWLELLLEASSAAETEKSEPIPQGILADALTALGLIRWSMGNFIQAVAPHQRALAIRVALHDQKGVAESLYHLGITAYRQDLYDEAKNYLNESLSISKVHGNKKGVAQALLNLGNIALSNRNQTEARDNYQKALAIEKELGDMSRVADALSNIGLTYGNDEDFDAASKYFEDTLKIKRSINDDYGTANALLCLAKTSYFQKDLKNFLDRLFEGLQIAFETENKYILAQFFIMLASYYQEQSEILKGFYFLCAYAKSRYDMGVTVESPTATEYHSILQGLLDMGGNERYELINEHVQSLSLRKVYEESLLILKTPNALSSISPLDELTEPDAQLQPPLTELLCPHCKNNKLVRFGRSSSGKQRFRCQTCHRVINENYGERKHDQARREEILNAYKKNGLSLRETSRMFGVSRNTLTNWIKQEDADEIANSHKNGVK